MPAEGALEAHEGPRSQVGGGWLVGKGRMTRLDNEGKKILEH